MPSAIALATGGGRSPWAAASDRAQAARGQRAAGRREHVSFLARIVPPPADAGGAAGPRVPRTVADLVRRLPLERKVAQLFLSGFEGQDLTAADLPPAAPARPRRDRDRPAQLLDSDALGRWPGEARVIAAATSATCRRG